MSIHWGLRRSRRPRPWAEGVPMRCGNCGEELVRAAVGRANSPAVWGEALRRGDPGPLATVWAGEPLAYFSGEVLAYRARGLRLQSSLVELEFLAVELLAEGDAVAETRERWA